MSADVAEQTCREDRAKPLRRTETPGALLDQALANTGVSKAEIARRWGISRPLVHHVIVGRKALTQARLHALPPLVYAEYRRLEARARGHVYAVPPESAERVDLHDAIARLSRDHSETMQAYLQAYAEGTASPGQKAEILREAQDDLEALVALIAALKGAE